MCSNRNSGLGPISKELSDASKSAYCVPANLTDMEETFFWGVDVSMDWVDVAIRDGHGRKWSFQVENSPKAITAMVKARAKEMQASLGQCLFCLENTGAFRNHLLGALGKLGVRVYMVPALHIKRSMGMVRGKNDRVDAERIALFLARTHGDLTPWEPSREVIEQLKYMMTKRDHLVRMRGGLVTASKEARRFHPKKRRGICDAIEREVNNTLNAQIKRIDRAIAHLIDQDQNLAMLNERIRSVPGVGPVSAAHFLAVTDEFKRFDLNPKKFSCYAGAAPFDHSSGKSIRGQTRVCHMANKTSKRLLHLCALRAVRIPGDHQNYYQRKLAEKKHPMSVLNAVRNKIIHRVFAVVRDQRLYTTTSHVLVLHAS